MSRDTTPAPAPSTEIQAAITETRQWLIDHWEDEAERQSDWVFAVLPGAIRMFGLQQTLFTSNVERQLKTLLIDECRYTEPVATLLTRLLRWDPAQPRPRIPVAAIDHLAKIPERLLFPVLRRQLRFFDGPGTDGVPCRECGARTHARCLAYDEIPITQRTNGPSLARFADQLRVQEQAEQAEINAPAQRRGLPPAPKMPPPRDPKAGAPSAAMPGPVPPPAAASAAPRATEAPLHFALPAVLTDRQFLEVAAELGRRWKEGQSQSVINAIVENRLGPGAAVLVVNACQGDILRSRALHPYAEQLLEHSQTKTQEG